MPLALVVGDQILIAGGVLALAVLAAVGTRRLRVPLLVTFLGLGMVLGSEGLGGIYSTTRSSRARSASSG